MTQQQVADELGWSRDKVAKYAALENVSPKAWRLIVTDFANNVTTRLDDDVTTNVTPVTENISPVAWDALAREIQNGVPSGSDGAVPQFGTPVPFTENLLRNILDLTEYHKPTRKG